jgi:hypothetical protein
VRFALGTNRAQLWEIAKNSGIDPSVWGKFLSSSVPPDMQDEMVNWSINDWSHYLIIHTPEIMAECPVRSSNGNIGDVLGTG